MFKYLIALILTGTTSFSVFAEDEQPYLYILGVTQDAGYPQAGCYKVHCMPGWKDSSLRQGPVSLALIDPKANQKYIFEPTPDFPSQLFDLELEAPDERFKLAGIFLTHAHIGHYSGLMFLGHESMGTSNVPVYAMPRMGQFLKSNGPWSQLIAYKNIILRPLQNDLTKTLGRLKTQLSSNSLSPEDLTEHLEAMTAALVKKLLHHPTVYLREGNDPARQQMAQEFFNLAGNLDRNRTANQNAKLGGKLDGRGGGCGRE